MPGYTLVLFSPDRPATFVRATVPNDEVNPVAFFRRFFFVSLVAAAAATAVAANFGSGLSE